VDQALTIVASVLASVATLMLISVGLAVIFGLMRVINLAHGEFLMLGAYAVLVGTRNGVSLWIAIPLAGLAVGYWPDQETIAKQWTADRQFVPAINSEERRDHRARWTRALERARNWEMP